MGFFNIYTVMICLVEHLDMSHFAQRLRSRIAVYSPAAPCDYQIPHSPEVEPKGRWRHHRTGSASQPIASPLRTKAFAGIHRHLQADACVDINGATSKTWIFHVLWTLVCTRSAYGGARGCSTLASLVSLGLALGVDGATWGGKFDLLARLAMPNSLWSPYRNWDTLKFPVLEGCRQ